MPSLNPPQGRGAEVPRVALLGTLLLAEPPSLKAKLEPPKQLYFSPSAPPTQTPGFFLGRIV